MAERVTTPISKAGIWMSKDNITGTDKSLVLQGNLRTKAFTFIEVIVALTVVSISLLALFRLHLISIRMTETAEITSQAVFLAGQKIAEKLALGYPKEETDSGIVERNGLSLHWQTEVTDLQSPQLDEADITGLRRVLVDVNWKQGTGRKHLQMSTYVADWKLNEKKI
jgi:prepilin-type N-terminal cleavage/methylation domain-containing protein